MGRILRVSAFLIELAAASVCAFFINLFVPSMRDVWIVSERGNDARDNGYFFYRYLVTQHPEQRVYYIISRASADFERIRSLGKWADFESFKHFVLYALCKVRISSSLWGGDLPKTDYCKKLRRFIGRKKTFIFLQHGITKDYLPQLCYGQGDPAIYVCGAKPEYDYVSANFGYPEGVVRYLGLARFDNLHENAAKRQILFMPTFRKWLQNMTEDEIAQSEFVRRWNEAINDPDLLKLLEENDLDLIFYPHYVLQKYVRLFRSPSPRVKIAAFRDYDVQTLLIESKLLVTDFSSVFFDFGYMGKPVVYYQFDRDRYIKEHYDFTKGYFSYDGNGFGDVVFDKKELSASIGRVIGNAFEPEEKYQNRIRSFFPLKDQHNCDRIYDEIIRTARQKRR